MEQGRFALGADHQPDVADLRDVAVNDRVQSAHRVHRDAAQFDAAVRGQPFPARQVDRLQDLRLDPDLRLRIVVDQGTDVLGVDMVGVLVGDQDRVQVAHIVPGGGEVARVDQDCRSATSIRTAECPRWVSCMIAA